MAPVDWIHVMGTGCVSDESEDPALVFVTAVDATGDPATAGPLAVTPQPDGSWSAFLDAPDVLGTATVVASCSNYLWSTDYPAIQVEVREFVGEPVRLVDFSEGSGCIGSVSVRTEVEGMWTVGPTLPRSEFDGYVETDPAKTGWDLLPAAAHTYTLPWVINPTAVALSPAGFVFGTAPMDQEQVLPPTASIFTIPWSALSAQTRQACLGSADPLGSATMKVDRTAVKVGEAFTVTGSGCPPPFYGTELIDPITSFPPLGVSVMVTGDIDPSTVTPAADGTWTWTTSTGLPRDGGPVTVTARCVMASGSFDYQSISLTVKGAGAGGGGGGKQLSKTGSDAEVTGLLGLGLLLSGSALMIASRRRSAAELS